MRIAGKRRYHSVGYPNPRAPIIVYFGSERMIYSGLIYALTTARVMADRYGCARVEWDTLDITYWRIPYNP